MIRRVWERKHPHLRGLNGRRDFRKARLLLEQETELNIENIEEFADGWLCISEAMAGEFESSSISRVLSQIREYMEA